MKTELKTAEQHLKDQIIRNSSGDYTSIDYIKYKSANKKMVEVMLKAIESHTSERLDHLRQQLEAFMNFNNNKYNETESGHPMLPVYEWKAVAFQEAISLIDQLKAENKNT